MISNRKTSTFLCLLVNMVLHPSVLSKHNRGQYGSMILQVLGCFPDTLTSSSKVHASFRYICLKVETESAISTFQPKHHCKAPTHCSALPVFYPKHVSVSMINWNSLIALCLHGHSRHVQTTKCKECREIFWWDE